MIRETCRCGAVFNAEPVGGPWGASWDQGAVRAFRIDHARCRDAFALNEQAIERVAFALHRIERPSDEREWQRLPEYVRTAALWDAHAVVAALRNEQEDR